MHSASHDVRAFSGSSLLRLSSSMAIRQQRLIEPAQSGGAEDAAGSPLHCRCLVLSGHQMPMKAAEHLCKHLPALITLLTSHCTASSASVVSSTAMATTLGTGRAGALDEPVVGAVMVLCTCSRVSQDGHRARSSTMVSAKLMQGTSWRFASTMSHTGYI